MIALSPDTAIRLLLSVLPLLLLFVYLLLWFGWGRDPDMPTVIPLFAPSPGRTPGFLRFVRRMEADSVCFTAEILHLAVEGYIMIEEVDGEQTERKRKADASGKVYSLKRTEKRAPDAPGAEATLLEALFEDGGK